MFFSLVVQGEGRQYPAKGHEFPQVLAYPRIDHHHIIEMGFKCGENTNQIY